MSHTAAVQQAIETGTALTIAAICNFAALFEVSICFAVAVVEVVQKNYPAVGAIASVCVLFTLTLLFIGGRISFDQYMRYVARRRLATAPDEPESNDADESHGGG